MRIDPKLIIEFAAIAEESSFTRAAQRLRVAQPWLSSRLNKLEEILGFRLFHRTTRSVSLTERGAEFLDAARAVADAAQAADRLALQLRRRDHSVLRIGAAPYTKIVVQRRDLIDQFTRSHAGSHLELVTGWSHALMDRLDSGDIDLSFVVGTPWPPQFELIPLRDLGLGLTVSREHPLAGKQTVPPQAVAGATIQVFTRSLYPSLWDDLYAPLITVGAALIEMPEIAEGPPSTMRSPGDIAAFLDFGKDDPGTADVVRVAVESTVAIPFQLARRRGHSTAEADAFWSLASRLA